MVGLGGSRSWLSKDIFVAKLPAPGIDDEVSIAAVVDRMTNSQAHLLPFQNDFDRVA